MTDKYEIYEYEDGFKRVLKNGKAINEFGLLKEVQKLQAENENLKKQNSELFILKERFKARNHKALDYLYSEDCDSAYNARCALEGWHHE